MLMSGRLLLFGFEELPTILAAAAAAGPFGAEVVPVTFMMRPALVMALLAAEAVIPTTLGTVQGVSGFSCPR